jgi:hypothetical protein
VVSALCGHALAYAAKCLILLVKIGKKQTVTCSAELAVLAVLSEASRESTRPAGVQKSGIRCNAGSDISGSADDLELLYLLWPKSSRSSPADRRKASLPHAQTGSIGLFAWRWRPAIPAAAVRGLLQGAQCLRVPFAARDSARRSDRAFGGNHRVAVACAAQRGSAVSAMAFAVSLVAGADLAGQLPVGGAPGPGSIDADAAAGGAFMNGSTG